VTYRIVVAGAARRDLKRLDRPVARAVVEAIDALANDPRPPGSKELVGFAGVRRIRVEAWRIAYRVGDDTIEIIAAAHRNHVYDYVRRRL
jgi:mRNA interferase RelE/StbE